jgi:PQQ enzyme repeat
MGIRFRFVVALCASAALTAPAIAPPCRAQSVLTYHGNADRSGNFVIPSLSWERAPNVRLDTAFHAHFAGHLYAQPLFWQPAGSSPGMLIAATEDNTVHAIDARSGNEIWSRPLGRPVPLSRLPCGNIDPLGITGTPVIDETRQAVYLDAMVADASGPRHHVFALLLKDGSPMPGWPVDVEQVLAAEGQRFNSRDQNQRGALAILGGRIYIPYGGHYGDCGSYYGWVLGIGLGDPRDVVVWRTRARGGGIWAPGGIGSDGQWLFVSTGNTIGVNRWNDGEAVFRLAPDLHRNDSPHSFFAPADWRALDERDGDLGGTNPLPFDLPAGSGRQALILALGKDAHAYLLDRNNLGGIGGSLVSEVVSTRPIRTSPAVYPAPDGLLVAFQGQGAHCPTPGRDNNLTVLRVRAGWPPSLGTAWCGAFSGEGSPIVTTTDGHSSPIVWIVGAEGDGRLHGFRGYSGEPLFTGGGPSDRMTGLRHFQSLLAAGDRLYVGADNRIYAFSF